MSRVIVSVNEPPEVINPSSVVSNSCVTWPTTMPIIPASASPAPPASPVPTRRPVAPIDEPNDEQQTGDDRADQQVGREVVELEQLLRRR